MVTRSLVREAPLVLWRPGWVLLLSNIVFLISLFSAQAKAELLGTHNLSWDYVIDDEEKPYVASKIGERDQF